MAFTAARWRRARQARSWLVPALVACVVTAVPVHAQAPSAEAEAKARFALALLRFVQWPAGAREDHAALRLCVIHRSPALAAAFASREGVMVAGRPLEVIADDAVRVSSCDSLFVDASAGSAGSELLAGLAGRPVFTLGTVDGFLSRGGMVELVHVDDALRFDVGLKPMRAARIGLSSQALKLARRVQE